MVVYINTIARTLAKTNEYFQTSEKDICDKNLKKKKKSSQKAFFLKKSWWLTMQIIKKMAKTLGYCDTNSIAINFLWSPIYLNLFYEKIPNAFIKVCLD